MLVRFRLLCIDHTIEPIVRYSSQLLLLPLLLFKVHRNFRSGPKEHLVGRLPLKGKKGHDKFVLLHVKSNELANGSRAIEFVQIQPCA